MTIYNLKTTAITCLTIATTFASVLVIIRAETLTETLSTQITRSILKDDATDVTTLLPLAATSLRPTFGNKRFRNNLSLRYRLIRRRRKTTPINNNITITTVKNLPTIGSHLESSSITASPPTIIAKPPVNKNKVSSKPTTFKSPDNGRLATITTKKKFDRKTTTTAATQSGRSRLSNGLSTAAKFPMTTKTPSSSHLESPIMPRSHHQREMLGPFSAQRTREDFGFNDRMPQLTGRGFAQQLPHHHPMMINNGGFFPQNGGGQMIFQNQPSFDGSMQQNQQSFGNPTSSGFETGFLPTPSFGHSPPMHSLPGFSHNRPIGEDYEDYEFYGLRPFPFLHSQATPFGLAGTGNNPHEGGNSVPSTAALFRPPVSSASTFGLIPLQPASGIHNGLPASVQLTHSLQVNGGGGPGSPGVVSRPIGASSTRKPPADRFPFEDTRGRFGDVPLGRSSSGGGVPRPNVIEVEAGDEWSERPRGVLITVDSTPRSRSSGGRRPSFGSSEFSDLGLEGSNQGRRNEGTDN